MKVGSIKSVREIEVTSLGWVEGVFPALSGLIGKAICWTLSPR